MSKPDIWMPLVIGDYLADTAHLSTAEHGAYLLLLMTAWMRGGVLPDDDAQLARITRASCREWKTLRASLAPFFHVADGGWRQKRLQEELARAQAVHSSQCAKASKGAYKRWGKDPSNDAPSIAPSNAPGIAQAILHDAPPPPHSPSLRSGEKSARKKEIPVPDDFAISDRVRAWAKRKGYSDSLLETALEIFIGRHRANGKRYVEWDETFMNAVREDWYDLRKPTVGAPTPFDVETHAKKVGLSARPGESMEQFVMRVRQTREAA